VRRPSQKAGSPIDASHNAQIIFRANQLWEEAGSPEGEQFYDQAEEELREQERSNPDAHESSD
jgi:hypothetical protein